MTLLDLIENRPGFKRQSVRTWEGPCPRCGGSKRFIAWVQEDKFACRECDLKGDIITWFREVEGENCPQAHLAAGKTCESFDCEAHGRCAATRAGAARAPRSDKQRKLQTPEVKEKRQDGWRPTEATDPQEKWLEKAGGLVDKAHEALLNNPEQLAFLAGRGIPRGAVERRRLGWLDQDLYRDRESWGLDPILKDDGKKKKLWIPMGIVIPAFRPGGAIFRIRIRRPQVKEGEPRYYWVPGSGDDTWILNPQARAFVVVESDLDGVLIDWHAGDLVGTVPLGTCSARPREAAAKILDSAVCILNALDFEPRINTKNGRHENPGGENWLRWWKPRYPQAKRHPAPGGKDPGEAFQAGADIRAWIIAGLPAGLRPAQRKEIETWERDPTRNSASPAESTTAAAPSAAASPDTPTSSAADASTTTSAANNAPEVLKGTLESGRVYYITPDRAEYIRLRDSGAAVFTPREIAMLREMQPTPRTVEMFIDLKEIFAGPITEVGPDPGWLDEAV